MFEPKKSVTFSNEDERLFHESSKPSWSQSGLMIHRTRRSDPRAHANFREEVKFVSVEDCSLRASKLTASDPVRFTL